VTKRQSALTGARGPAANQAVPHHAGARRPYARRPGPRGRRSATATRTRERVLHRAQQLFARKGYGATSLRELAKAAGVRLFTIQHHFGSKQQLYAEIIRRWDEDVRALVSGVLKECAPSADPVARVVDVLFDYFLIHRARVALNARAMLGEGLPRRVLPSDRSWVRFVNAEMTRHRLTASGLDTGLLLITVEGILHNHVLAAPHYRHLYGRAVTNARLAARVKRHLTQVILRLVGTDAAAIR